MIGLFMAGSLGFALYSLNYSIKGLKQGSSVYKIPNQSTITVDNKNIVEAKYREV